MKTVLSVLGSELGKLHSEYIELSQSKCDSFEQWYEKCKKMVACDIAISEVKKEICLRIYYGLI